MGGELPPRACPGEWVGVVAEDYTGPCLRPSRIGACLPRFREITTLLACMGMPPLRLPLPHMLARCLPAALLPPLSVQHLIPSDLQRRARQACALFRADVGCCRHSSSVVTYFGAPCFLPCDVLTVVSSWCAWPAGSTPGCPSTVRAAYWKQPHSHHTASWRLHFQCLLFMISPLQALTERAAPDLLIARCWLTA